MVAILWIFDTVHTVFVIRSLYAYLITNFGNIAFIPTIEWGIPAGILITSTSDTVVRAFFSYRIFILSQRRILPVIPVFIIALIIWGIGIAFAEKTFTISFFPEMQALAWLLYLALGLVVVGDAYIAGVLCYYLRKSRVGIKRTDSLLNLLMIYTVQTGAITSIFSMGCFIAFAVQPGSYVFLALYFPLSKLYTNALFATLNARSNLRENSTGSVVSTIPTLTDGRASFLPIKQSRSDGSPMGQGVSVQVETTTDRHYEVWPMDERKGRRGSFGHRV